MRTVTLYLKTAKTRTSDCPGPTEGVVSSQTGVVRIGRGDTVEG